MVELREALGGDLTSRDVVENAVLRKVVRSVTVLRDFNRRGDVKVEAQRHLNTLLKLDTVSVGSSGSGGRI